MFSPADLVLIELALRHYRLELLRLSSEIEIPRPRLDAVSELLASKFPCPPRPSTSPAPSSTSSLASTRKP